MNLFDYADTYPLRAGYKGAETSLAAAESIPASIIRGKVLTEFQRRGAMTADECAESLRIDKLTVRPRCSELHNLGKLIDTGLRRHNSSGRRAIVWRIP